MKQLQFSKVLAQYYHTWLRDSFDSADYCLANGDHNTAEEYLNDARNFFHIINENWDAIEFFSIDSNAFKYDAALPIEYRGYN